MPPATEKKKKSRKTAQETPDTQTHQDVSIPEELTPEKQIEMMRGMVRIRRLEERCTQLYGQGKIGGFCHLYIGQEAVAAGCLMALKPGDYTITTYRDHGLALLRDCPPMEIFAELMGREAGTVKARGGSMHFFNKDTRFMGGHGIVGAHIPLGTGMAFASKYRGEDNVTLCLFGEGAVNNGAFHESLNLAALWDLPIVFICENNRYGMGTPQERSTSVYDIHKKAEGYDMEHDMIDGMDVLAVYKGMKEAVARARNGRPSFVEIRTYRFRGHSMSDPIHSHYRTKNEVEEQKGRDPITLWRASLTDRGIMSEDELKEMDKEITEEMKEAIKQAEASPEPDLSTVLDYVYAD